MIYENCLGGALIGSLMLAVVLTTLGFAAITTLTIQSRIGIGYANAAQAFYLAEAASQHAMGILDTPSGGACDGFDDELSTNGGVMLDGVPFAGGIYTTFATDNNDDGDPTDDSDNIIILTSDGRIGTSSSAVEVVVTIGGGSGGCGLSIISWREVKSSSCGWVGKIKKKVKIGKSKTPPPGC